MAEGASHTKERKREAPKGSMYLSLLSTLVMYGRARGQRNVGDCSRSDLPILIIKHKINPNRQIFGENLDKSKFVTVNLND